MEKKRKDVKSWKDRKRNKEGRRREKKRMKAEKKKEQMPMERKNKSDVEQGRIHGYRSRVRVGRGSDKKAKQAFRQEQLYKKARKRLKN